MEIPNGCYRTSIKALILDKDKKFLLIKEDNGLWELPGGAMDFGENYEQTLIREIREEMGLQVIEVANNPSYFTSFQNQRGTWTTNIIFETKVKDLNFVKTTECVEIGFFDRDLVKLVNISPGTVSYLEKFDPSRH